MTPGGGLTHRHMSLATEALRELGLLPDGYRAIPGPGLRTNAYGNPAFYAVADIVGHLQARERGGRLGLVEYFGVRPGSQSPLRAGVYERREDEIRCVLLFVSDGGLMKLLSLRDDFDAQVRRILDDDAEVAL